MRWGFGLFFALGIANLQGAALESATATRQSDALPNYEVSEPGESGQRVDEGGVFGNYFPARSDYPELTPALLLLGGSEGGLGRGPKYMAIALQQEGFSVLQLAYFGAPGQSNALERIPLELFDRGLDWLKEQPGVDPKRLAVLGASKGAEAALLVATRHADVRAVVAGMPTSVVWGGINWARGGQSLHSSWTVSGEDVPTMPYTQWSPAEGIISVYRSIEDPSQQEHANRAAIPIEQSNAKMLLVCGEAETMWPACPMSQMLASRSAARAGPAVTILAYKHAGHLVFGLPIPADSAFYPRLGAFGGSVEGNAAARADSWPKVIEFLKDSMKDG